MIQPLRKALSAPHFTSQKGKWRIFVWVVSIAVWASSTDCYARIGESVEECKARYGHLEQGNKPNIYTARANGLVIVLQFLGDKCAMITYVKEKAERFSENELSILLDNNIGEGKWS